jgi:hypothetical protein
VKILAVIVFCTLAVFGVFLRWYQLKDSLSNYVWSKNKTREDQSEDVNQRDS